MADIQNEAIVVGSQAKALDQHISICYHVHMVPRKKNIQAISYLEEQRALKVDTDCSTTSYEKKKKNSFRALLGWAIPDKTRKPDSKTQ